MNENEFIEHLNELRDFLEKKFEQIPTKAYLDEKIAKLWGIDFRHDQQIIRLLEVLRTNNTITDGQFEELTQYKAFSP